MGRFRTLTILLTLGLWGATTDGAPPDDAAPASRGALPPGVQAGDYVKAVARLCNAGKHDQAGPYLKAAMDFRDQLSPAEQATLDQYARVLSQGAAAMPTPPVPSVSSPLPSPSASAAAPRDRAVALVAAARAALDAQQPDEARRLAREADALGVPFSGAEDNPARILSEADRKGSAYGASVRAAGNNSKQQALWYLHSAREQIRLGNADAAAGFLAQAKEMNVRWTLFDDTPAKVEADLAKLRATTPALAAAPAAGLPMDKKQAKVRMKEARAALDAGDYTRAEQLAREVESAQVNFTVLEESPGKIVAAAQALRRREAARRGKGAQSNQEFYDVLVAESRQMLNSGKLAEAEARAKQAQKLNVVPNVTSDRAEAVLHDLAMVKARGGDAVAAPVMTAATVAEQQADALLAQNQVDAARAKFEEAERLRAQELGQPAGVPIAMGPAAGTADPAIVRTQASEPIGLTIPGDPAPAAEAPALATPAAGNDALEQARALLVSGNHRAAKAAALQAKQAGAGLDADNLLAQIAQSQQAAAMSLYEAALDGIRKGEVARSRALLNELAADDLDEAMAQRVQDLLTKIPGENSGQAPRAPAGLGSAGDDAEVVKAQQLNAEVGTKVAEARRKLETDPAEAVKILEQTMVAVKAAGLSEPVTRTLVRRLEVAIELAKKDQVAFDEKMKEKNFREEIERKRLRILEADKAKQERMKQFMDKAMAAQAEGDWVEAEKFAKLAAEVDPNEIAATALATKARIMRHYERDKQIRSDAEESRLNAWQEVDAAAVVSEDVIKRSIDMGGDFKALTERRRALAERLAYNPKSAKTVEIEKILNRPITLPNSDRMTLGEAIKYLAEYTGINIVPDQLALNEEGLTLDTPVNLTAVNNIKLKSVLKFMLNPLHLSYTIDDEVLVITSPQSGKAKMYTQVYSVADLVMSPAKINKNAMQSPGNGFVAPPGLAGNSANDPNVLQAQAAAMTGATPAPIGSTGGATSQVMDRDKPEFEPLIHLIKSTCAPGSWSNDHTPMDALNGAFGQGAGGGFGGNDSDAEGVGSITPFYLNISLIIRQAAEVHDEIVDLLRQLRRLQDLQVSVEVRFIAVGDSFFEQIGVDFDFAIQSDAVGRKSSFAIPNPAAFPIGGGGTGGTGTTAATQPYLINPIRDHAYGRQPLVVGMNGPTNDINNPSFNPNLMLPFTQSTSDAATNIFNAIPNLGGTFGLAFLSDLEVYLFLQAIQGDTRSNLVQAPKVTSFNGAPASVANFEGINYVSSLIPIVGGGSVAFTPQVQTFPDGVQLFVTPVVSADRRYVRLSLSPVFTTFLGFDNFSVPAAVGGGGLGGQSSTINAQLQLPRFTFTNVTTTVTVPDGGTVLLGGVKRLREERREFGVPILSKTPMIDRLFRNIGIGRRTDSLMLMVTPRIIILEEEEERLGIPAVQNTF